MKRKSILTAIVLFGILLSVFSGGAARSEISVSADSASEPLEVTFSHESGFYSTSFELTLTATDESADIYFTTNGSAPTITSVKYSGSIPVIVLGDVDVLSVKAIAVKGAETSKEFTRNFVKGANVHSRFGEDTLVFVLSGEDNDFWGYENGILRVDGGIDRANWIAQETIRLGRPPRPGPDYMGGEINPDKPANFNRKTHTSERRVYLEMFDSSGNSYISRGAGVRVKGGWSRAHNQKSLEFYANDGRDEDGNAINNGYFNYPFFYENSEDGNIINRYRRFRLRNGGGQRTGCFVRDELGADLLRQAGFPDTQMHVPAAVFLNGEYYGVRWLKTPKTENHLRHRYGGVTERFWYMSGGENYNKGQEEEDSVNAEAIDDWRENVYEFAKGGLLDETRWTQFRNRVDIDDMMMYYAFHIYTQNLDWPNWNMEMWKYNPTEEEKNDPDLHPYLRDGKWRWQPHDMDETWSPWGQGGGNSIHAYVHGPPAPAWQGTSALLKAVLQRPEMRAKLANTFVDLMEGALRPDNVNATINRLASKINHEHNYSAQRGMLKGAEGTGGPAGPGDAEYNRQIIRSFANTRPDLMLGYIAQPWNALYNSGLGFNWYSRYTVNLTTGEGGGAVMNARHIAESETETGNYYSGTSINITAKPYTGYEVGHWVVNGTQTSASDVITVSNSANVELHFKKSADLTLYINAIKGTYKNSESNDWVEIHNPTDSAVSTRGLYLSDSNNNFFKWQLPPITIQPNETFRFVTDGNSVDPVSKKRTRLNFNAGFSETVRLTRADGNVLSVVEVSFMRENDVQRCGNDRKYTVDKAPPVCSGCGGALPCYDCIPPYAVRLMAQSALNWNRQESSIVSIKGNGTYTAVLNVPSLAHLVNLAIRTDGATFIHPTGFDGLNPPPGEWMNARVNIDSVTINGDVIGGSLDAVSGYNYLISRRSAPSGGGNVNLTLWDGWSDIHRRLTGITEIYTGDGFENHSYSFGRLDNSPITTITVTFTVSGIQ